MSEHDVMAKHLHQLKGRGVQGVVRDNSSETLEAFGQPLYGLAFEDKIAWVLADPEGNGPGFLEIAERSGGSQSPLLEQLREAVFSAEMILADIEVAKRKGYFVEERKKVFAAADRIRKQAKP